MNAASFFISTAGRPRFSPSIGSPYSFPVPLAAAACLHQSAGRWSRGERQEQSSLFERRKTPRNQSEME